MRALSLLLVFCLLPLLADAHAVPDIPVRTWFSQDGTCTVTVEVDPAASRLIPMPSLPC